MDQSVIYEGNEVLWIWPQIFIAYWATTLSITTFCITKLSKRIKNISLDAQCSYAESRNIWDPFVEQRLVLSSSFRCGLIHNCHKHHFGHTLLWYLTNPHLAYLFSNSKLDRFVIKQKNNDKQAWPILKLKTQTKVCSFQFQFATKCLNLLD